MIPDRNRIIPPGQTIYKIRFLIIIRPRDDHCRNRVKRVKRSKNDLKKLCFDYSNTHMLSKNLDTFSDRL